MGSLDKYVRARQAQSGVNVNAQNESGSTTKPTGGSLDKYILARQTKQNQPFPTKKKRTIEDVRADMERVKTIRDNASARRKNYGGRGSWLMYADPNAATSMNKLASEDAEKEFQYFDAEYNRLRTELYQMENESARKALDKDAAAAEKYAAGQTARSNMDKLIDAYLPMTGLNADQATYGYQNYAAQLQQMRDREELQKKYGAYDPIGIAARIGASERQAASELEKAGYNFDRMADYELRQLDAVARETEREENLRFANEHGTASSLATIGAAPAQGLDYLSIAGQTIANEIRGEDDWRPVNTDKLHVTNFVTDVRGQVGQNIEENTDWKIGDQNVARFLYDTAMSMGDSAATIMLGGPAASVLLGGAAASQTAINVLENGGTATQATLSGMAAGAAEAIFEKYSIEKLLEPKNVSSVKRLVFETLKQGGVEGSEEVATEIANILSNAVIMGGNSDFNKTVEYYESQGMTEEEAKKQAYRDCVGQVAWAFAGGALSGGVMGGGVNTRNLAVNAAMAQEMYGSDPEALISQTLAADEGNQLAKKLQDRVRNKQGISGLQLSTLNEQRLSAFEKQEKAQEKSGEHKVTIEQASQKYGKQAEAMKTTYNSDQDVKQFDKAFGAMHSLAKLGIAYDIAVEDESVSYLTDEQKKLAYDIGRTADGAVELADEVSEYEVSSEGKTVQKSTDKAVQLGEVVSVDGGIMTFALSDGSEAVSTDLSYATEDEAVLYSAVNYAANTAAEANTMIGGYADSGMTADAYSAGIRHAFNYGRNQMPMAQMLNIPDVKKLPANVRKAAYEAGKNLRAHRTGQKQATVERNRKNGKKADKVGRVLRLNGTQQVQSFREYQTQNGRQLTEVQEASIFGMERLAALMGVDMYVYESYVNSNGERVFRDDAGHEYAAPNGYYENGKVYIDLNAGDYGEGTMLFTVSHELTHFIKEWSPAKYDILCEILMDGYAREGISVDRLVREQMYKAQQNGRKLSYEEALEEVVADSMESMLADGRVVEMMAELKQRDKSLWQKIRDFFADLLDDLKAMVDAYKEYKPNSKEGRMVAEMQNVIDKIQPIFAEALLDAGDAYQTTTKNTAEDGGVKYQARPFAEQVEDVKNNTHDRNNHVYMGTTPTRLSNILGLPKAPMLITPNHVYSIAVSKQQAKKEKRYKKNVHYHSLGWDMVKKLPRIMNEPQLLIKSTNDPNDARFVIVSNQVDADGNPIFIAVKPNGKGNYINIEFVSNITLSAYGKLGSQNYVNTAKKENRILYAYKKRSQNKNTTGVQFPNNILNSDYSKNLSDFQTIVKAEFKDTIYEKSGLPKFSFRNATAIDGVASAEQMERDGKSRAEIWHELGLIRDAAGNWVTEIDDSNAEFYAAGDARLQNNPDWMRYKELEGKMINRTITDEEHRELKELAVVVRVLRRGSTLQDYLKHDELYRAAPYLKDIPFRMEIMGGRTKGKYNKSGITVDNGQDADERLSTTLHEAQHAIHDEEGRPGGASPEYWQSRLYNGEIIRKNDKRIAAARDRRDAAWDKMSEALKSKVREINRESIAAKDSGNYDRLTELQTALFNSEDADLYAEYDDALWEERLYSEYNEPLSAQNLYYQTAGEIEASLVQQRRNMTAEQRRARMPDFQWDDAVFAETKNTTGNGGVRYQARSAKESPEVVSIKEQIAANQNELNSMDAVADVRVPELRNWNTKQRRKWAEDELRKSGYQIDRQGFGQINFNPSQINKALNYLNDAGEIAGFAALPRVLKRGRVIFDNDNHKGRNFRTVTFAAPVKINGVRGNMAAVVQQTKGYNYHMHRVLMPDGSSFVFENKKDTEGTPAGALSQRDTHAEPITSVSDTSIFDYKQNSNRKFSNRNRTAQKTAAALERENKRLKQDIKYLRELVRLQKKVTGGTKMKRADVENMAKLLMKNNNIKGDYRELSPMLTELYEFMAANEDIGVDAIREKAQPAVDWMLNHVKKNRQLDPYAEEILGVLKSSTVRFNDGQKAEAASLAGGWGKYRNSVIGAVGVSDKSATTLDQLWADLSRSYPAVFDADIPDTQQPAALLEIIEDLRSMKHENYDFDSAMLEQAFMQDVYDGYWRVSTLDTVADIYQKRIDELKAIHFEEMEQSKAALIRQMDLQEAAYQQFMDETLAEERAQVQKQKDEYSADRREAVEKRKKTARKKSIQKTAHKLDALLNRGTKENNIKEGMQEFVSRALSAANAIMQTDNELDYIRFGVAVELTSREREVFEKAQGYLKEIDAYWEIEDAYDSYDEIKRTINKLERYLSDLKDLHGREIAARKRMNLEVPEDFSVIDMINEPIHCFISNREAQKAEAVKELQKQVYQLKPSELGEYKKMKRLESRLNYRMKQLSDVFERERNRRDKMTVSTILNDLAVSYKALEGATGYLSGAYNVEVYEYLDSLKDKIGKANVKDMSLYQLECIDEAFTMVYTTVKNVNEAFTDERKRSITEMGETAMSELKGQKQIPEEETKTGRMLKRFHWNNMKPVYAFERIGSVILKERFNAVRKGEDIYAQDVTEARQFWVEKCKEYGFNDWDLDERFEFEDSHGKKFKLDRNQMMSIYAYSRREQAIEHFMEGGIVIDTNTDIKGEKRYGVPVNLKPTTANTYHIGVKTLEKISQTLTEAQRKFAQELQDYLSNEMAAKGNEVSLKMYGIKLFKEKHYFPLRSDPHRNNKVKEQQEQAAAPSPKRLKNSGMTKAVTPGANNPIILSGFMETWSGHVDEMSMYHAFVLPLEDFIRVYNYNVPASEGGDAVSAFLQNAHGAAATQYISQLIDDLNGGARSDPRENTMKQFVAKWKKASVFTSLSVVIQQPSSIGRAFALINPKYFRPADFVTWGKNHEEVWDEVKKYAPVAIIKEMGYFDTNMGQSTADFLVAKDYGKWRDNFAENIKAMAADSQYRDDQLSRLPALADEKTWCTIWGAVKRELSAQEPKADIHSAEFLEKCGDRFTEVITKTQVYDSVLARSGNMRSKGMYMSMATAFLGEPTTSINMVEDAIYKAVHGGDKATAAKTIGAVVCSVVLNSMLVSLIYAMRDDDEDETFGEKYISRLASEVFDGLNPLTYLPIVKDIYSLFQGYDIERADMSLFADLVNAVTNLSVLLLKDMDDMDDEEIAEHWRKIAEQGWGMVDYSLALFGIPFKNVRREINAVINTGKTLYKDATERDQSALSMKDAVWEEWKKNIPILGMMPNASKSDKLFNATVMGDKAYVKRLNASFDTESARNSALKKGLRENDPRIKEAAVLYVTAESTGDYTAFNKLKNKIISEKKFVQITIISAISTEVNKLTPDEVSETSSVKMKSMYTEESFLNAVARGKIGSADIIKEEIISTYVTNGESRDDAEDKFISNLKSDIKERLKNGDISDNAAYDLFVQYTDMDADEAQDEIYLQQFKREHDGVNDITKAAVIDYYDYAEPAGIEAKVFYSAWKQYNSTPADYTASGGTIRNSKTKKLMPYIDSLPLTAEQKTALALCWWSPSTVRKYKLW